MTGISKSTRGMTLIEILVAGALFGLFTGMVAGALIMAHRTQDASVAKLDAIRRAALALDLLVRDIEAARFSSNVDFTTTGALDSTPRRPVDADELQIHRFRRNPTAAQDDQTESVIAGYWFDPGNGQPGQGVLRRALYGAGFPLTPVPGEYTDGRVLVRDVREFQVSSTTSAGLSVIEAKIWISSIGSALEATVATESPTAP